MYYYPTDANRRDGRESGYSQKPEEQGYACCRR